MVKHISRQEFIEKATKNDYEVYSEEQVRSFQSDIVKSIDPIERKNGAIDFASLNREVVINNDLSKSVLFWRPSQIEFKEEIDENTLQKSKTGYYKDTPENRAKGVVGKPYGDQKAEDYDSILGSNSAVTKMKMDYAQAKKSGNKEALAKVKAQMQAYEDKIKGKEKKDVPAKKED